MWRVYQIDKKKKLDKFFKDFFNDKIGQRLYYEIRLLLLGIIKSVSFI